MRVFPHAEHRQSPIDADRDKRKKKPEPRKRLNFFDVPPKRVDQKSKQQTEINPKTPRANREMMPLDVQRSFRQLMTDVAEERV